MDIPDQIGTLFALCGNPGWCDWTSLNTWKHVSGYCHVYKIGLTCLWRSHTKSAVMSAMRWLRLCVSVATPFSPRRVRFVQEGIQGRDLVGYVATQFWFRLWTWLTRKSTTPAFKIFWDEGLGWHKLCCCAKTGVFRLYETQNWVVFKDL